VSHENAKPIPVQTDRFNAETPIAVSERADAFGQDFTVPGRNRLEFVIR